MRAPDIRFARRFGDNSHMTATDPIAGIRFNADGLVPVIAQDRSSGDVLMLAWADAEAIAHTIETRQATYFSRSRGEQWIKGATSGATQHVHEVRLDCDGDAVLYVVDQTDGACHTGDRTCFDANIILGSHG